MIRWRARRAALAALISFSAAARSQAPRKPLESITHHAARIDGHDVRYTATVAEYFVKDTTGKLLGSVVTTAYTRDDVADRATRPVMFLFNGGPGASSSPLHLSAFGPVRRSGDSLVNNPNSPLDVVDLVFIDPVGTGFSRLFPGVTKHPFWSRSGDAASVRSVIEGWVKQNRRDRSPKYLCGESYGTTRAALILDKPGALRFDGVLLFAIVGSAGGREMPYVVTLPTFATTAWFYEKVPRNGRTVEQVFNDATEFARTEYVTALIRGGSLSAGERHRVAQKMSSLIGLSPELIEAKNLRVSKDTFMLNLLKDRGVRTGQLDARATARLDAPKRRPPYDDPGMNYDPEAPAGGASPALPQASAAGSPVDSYFKRNLAFHTTETYDALNLDVNAAWNYEGMSDVNPLIGDAMRRNPSMRLLWAGGYFDITTPLYGARYALDEAGIPGDRITSLAFPSGHSVFMDAANRAVLSAAVRRFVTGAAR
ncbi:MAG: S10 family serine carboxypeptidase-like protein [Gemmatimonadaceae bacterium]